MLGLDNPKLWNFWFQYSGLYVIFLVSVVDEVWDHWTIYYLVDRFLRCCKSQIFTLEVTGFIDSSKRL